MNEQEIINNIDDAVWHLIEVIDKSKTGILGKIQKGILKACITALNQVSREIGGEE